MSASRREKGQARDVFDFPDSEDDAQAARLQTSKKTSQDKTAARHVVSPVQSRILHDKYVQKKRWPKSAINQYLASADDTDALEQDSAATTAQVAQVAVALKATDSRDRTSGSDRETSKVTTTITLGDDDMSDVSSVRSKSRVAAPDNIPSPMVTRSRSDKIVSSPMITRSAGASNASMSGRIISRESSSTLVVTRSSRRAESSKATTSEINDGLLEMVQTEEEASIAHLTRAARKAGFRSVPVSPVVRRNARNADETNASQLPEPSPKRRKVAIEDDHDEIASIFDSPAVVRSASRVRADRSPLKASAQRSMRKALVGFHRNLVDDEEETAPDSPSKRASVSRSHKKALPVDEQGSTKQQLFVEIAVPARNLLPGESRKSEQHEPDDTIFDFTHDTEQRRTGTPKSRVVRLDKTPVRPTEFAKPRHEQMNGHPGRKTATFKHELIPPAHMWHIKHRVLSKLQGRTQVPLLHRDAQFADVHALLRETIVRSESNSALLLGGRSTGKSLLIDSCLQSFKDEGHEFLVVRLSGLVQTDDRLALKSIARQLQPDNEDIANADIMTALLAILSHPRDFGESEEPLGTVIVLDHFEYFTQQPRQTLLYNLFDISQSKKAPICVLGLTQRVDAYESLEKRVKSRFSHRVLQLPSLDFEQFSGLCMSFLMSDPDRASLGDRGYGAEEPVAEENTPFKKSCSRWNNFVQGHYEDKQGPLRSFLRQIYYSTNDVSAFTTAIASVILHAGSAYPDFSKLYKQCNEEVVSGGRTSKDVSTALGPGRPAGTTEGKLELVRTLSALELGLLITACRTELRGQRVNFATCFDEHRTLQRDAAQQQRAQHSAVVSARVHGKPLCLGAWQRLARCGLLVPATAGLGAARGADAEFRVFGVDVRLGDVAAYIKAHGVRLPSGAARWLTL